MTVYDVATKVLDTENFPQHTIADLNSGITLIFLFNQEKPLTLSRRRPLSCRNQSIDLLCSASVMKEWRWNEINTHAHTHNTHIHTHNTHTHTHTRANTHRVIQNYRIKSLRVSDEVLWSTKTGKTTTTKYINQSFKKRHWYNYWVYYWLGKLEFTALSLLCPKSNSKFEIGY